MDVELVGDDPCSGRQFAELGNQATVVFGTQIQCYHSRRSQIDFEQIPLVDANQMFQLVFANVLPRSFDA
jgi:hypothetical protein